MKARKGQAVVEFALVVPLFITLLLGIVDIGFLYNHQLVLTNAAREGARLATLGHRGDQVRQVVLDYLEDSAYSPMPTEGDIIVDIYGGRAKVEISSAVPVLFSLSGPEVTLRAATKMRVE